MFINVLLFFKSKPLTSCIDDKMHISWCRSCPHVQSTKTKAEENVSVQDVTFYIIANIRSEESTDQLAAADHCHDQCGLSRGDCLTVHLLYLQMKTQKNYTKKSLLYFVFLSYNETVLLSIILSFLWIFATYLN